jgi:hypothetical protein
MTSRIHTPGLKTLTPGQFRGTQAGKKPGASYQGYLGYIARHRAAKLAQQNTDPLGQTTQGAIDQTIGRYTGMYGQPLTDPQIQGQAQGLIDPIVAAVTSNVNTRAKQAGDSIRGYTDSLAGDLGKIDFGAPYAGAKQEQAAIDSALQQSLTGGGQALSQDLSSRLAQIGEPAVGQAASGLADRGAALGTTELARGNNALSSLIAHAAAAKSYGQKLPGIARMGGLQDLAGVEQNATNLIGEQTADVMKLLPQIVQNLRGERSSLQGNKASLAAQLYSTLTGQNITKETARRGLIGDASAAYTNALPMPDASLTNQYGYPVDQYGQPVGGKVTPLPGYHVDPKTGQVVKDTNADKPKPPTADVRQKALKAIETYYWGVPAKTRADGSVANPEVPGVDYETAVTNLVQGFGYTRKQAEALANTRYKPGEDGRPTKTAAEFKGASSQKPVKGQTLEQGGTTYVFNGNEWVKK